MSAAIDFARACKLADDRAEHVMSHPGASGRTLAADPLLACLRRRAARAWDHLPRPARRAILRPTAPGGGA